MARSPKKTVAKSAGDGQVKIVCTCDRLPLEDGSFLVRDQVTHVPAGHAVNYEAAGRAKRV